MDGMIALDTRYSKFITNGRGLLNNRLRNHLTNISKIQKYKWPHDCTIYQWEKEDLAPPKE
jgi:hypothetical protein